MKKILLIDDSDTYTWCLQKYLQHQGYLVRTACTLKEVRAAIQEEMPLVVCCDFDLPDGSGMDFLDEVRAADKELPFILVSCHDKEDYEQEAKQRIFEDEDELLYRRLCKLPENDLELLTLLMVDGYWQADVARLWLCGSK